MAVCETILQYTTATENVNSKISVIVVCGGSSSIMKGIDKMFAEVKGVPVCIRSILAFQNCAEINDIVVVTKEENILKMQQLCGEYRLTKVTDIVVGGSCRQESVYNGLKRLTDDTDIVLIHDGARPFVTDDCIKRVIGGVRLNSAVTCAVSPKDTIKVIKPDGLVVSTPDRSTLSAVQTPQGFKFNLYRSAVEKFSDKLEEFTDDCSIVEAFGFPVYVVEGDYKNIKITTAEDLKIAQNFVEEI
jgi:2-C-methyl-D-erythritol 4-phosphate cytidylyltransferase